MEQMTIDWDDPTSIDWGNEDKEEPVQVQETSQQEEVPGSEIQIYKCTALYSYTVDYNYFYENYNYQHGY